MRRTLYLLTLAFTVLASSSALAQNWHGGRSNSFRVVTDMGDSGARDSLARFEQERLLIGEILHKRKIVAPQVLQIIEVRDAESLKRIPPGFPTDQLARGAVSW